MAEDLEATQSEAATKHRLNASAARAATGVACSVGAYALWGVFPIYFKLIELVPALEVLAHRIVWSVVLVGGLLSLQRGWRLAAQIVSQGVV